MKAHTQKHIDKNIAINHINVIEVVHWLQKGIKDLITCPGLAFLYGLLFWIVSVLIWEFLNQQTLLHDVAVPLLAIVILVLGPISALGLYNISKEISLGNVVSLKDLPSIIGTVFNPKGSSASVVLSLILIIMASAWMMFSPLIFAIFNAGSLFIINNNDSSIAQSIAYTFISGSNMAFTLAYGLFTIIFAWLAFMISWFSFPMVLEQNIDPFTAAITSVKASMVNKIVMLLWIPLVGILVLAALLTPYFIGLIIVIPILAHATWHAYTSMVDTT